MIKAWAFYRRSTDKQELSIEDQRKECQAYAASTGLEIAREFIPVKGYASGLSIERDTQFQEMIRLAELGGHGIRVLLVYDVSRFGRLAPESKIYWEQRFKRQGGMQVIYAKDEFKNDGSLADGLTKFFKHSEAHQYSVKLSELTLRGAKSHASLGHSAGGKAPYGYDRLLIDAYGKPVKVLRHKEHKADKMQRVVWAPSPEEKPTVQWIFETYEKGAGLNVLVHDLNKREVRSPRNLYWSKYQVHYMLRNRAYIGERVYNKTSYKGYRRGEKGSLKNSRDQWVIKEMAHEAIIDRDLFDRVQAKLKTRSIGQGRSYHRPYLLTGIAVCGNCNYRLNGWKKRGNGHEYLNYTCSGYLRIGDSVCRSFNVSVAELEGLALSAIREHIRAKTWKDEVRATLMTMIQDQFGDKSEQHLADLRKQLVSINQQMENIVEAIKLGRFSLALQEALTKLETQRTDIQRDLAEAEGRMSMESDIDTIYGQVLGLADDLEDMWRECATNEERKTFLKTFIYQVRVDHSPSEISATYHLFKIPQPQNKLAGYPIGIPGLTHGLSLLRGHALCILSQRMAPADTDYTPAGSRQQTKMAFWMGYPAGNGPSGGRRSDYAAA